MRTSDDYDHTRKCEALERAIASGDRIWPEYYIYPIWDSNRGYECGLCGFIRTRPADEVGRRSMQRKRLWSRVRDHIYTDHSEYVSPPPVGYVSGAVYLRKRNKSDRERYKSRKKLKMKWLRRLVATLKEVSEMKRRVNQ